MGKYLEGGKEAGGQLVDQRFCPRIVEGELRYNLIGDSLIGVIHKKPAEGGISAVGGTGSIYTFYGPEEPLFKSLTENFLGKVGCMCILDAAYICKNIFHALVIMVINRKTF